MTFLVVQDWGLPRHSRYPFYDASWPKPALAEKETWTPNIPRTMTSDPQVGVTWAMIELYLFMAPSEEV